MLSYSCLYCKLVSMISTRDEETDKVIEEFRKIGISVSGVHEFVCKYGIQKLTHYLKDGYAYLKEYAREISKKN